MTDPPSEPPNDTTDASADINKTETETDDRNDDIEELRLTVEEKYDLEDFDSRAMTEMSAEEWDAVFDPDSWITGTKLLDRVEADLKNRIADREVFARVERHSATEERPERLVAYSDEGYVTVYSDGSIEGQGTVMRDVKPTVALCSMEDYEITPPPEEEPLPDPSEVPESSSELGNLMIQIVAFSLLVGGLVLIGAAALGNLGESAELVATIGFVFCIISLLFFILVANARLSDRFRAEEYRNRLRAVGLGSDDRSEISANKPEE